GERELVRQLHAERAAGGEAAERELGARSDDRGRTRLELEERARLDRRRLLGPGADADELGCRARGLDEGLEPLDPGGLLLRAGEQRDPRVAVLVAEMLDEERDPGVVLERDGAGSGTVDDAVEEDAGRSRGADELLEVLGADSRGRDEQSVDLVVDERAECRDLALDAELRVHQ